MNITEETNQNLKNSPTNIFSFSSNINTVASNSNSLPWSQGPPQYIPWGHSPNSPPASLVTFNAQPPTSISQQISTNMSQMSSFVSQNQISFDQNIINNVNNQPKASTSNFGHNIISNNQPIASTSYDNKPILHCKRKANLEFSFPSKQHITEEKMAQHMSRLHISTESHPEQLPRGETEDWTAKQKRLYVCEEMRRLQTESILPSSLLNRLERPCMAVMLWQPPAKIPELIGTSQSITNSSLSSVVSQANNFIPQRAGNALDEDENDNNTGTIDLNNMEMDS